MSEGNGFLLFGQQAFTSTNVVEGLRCQMLSKQILCTGSHYQEVLLMFWAIEQLQMKDNFEKIAPKGPKLLNEHLYYNTQLSDAITLSNLLQYYIQQHCNDKGRI